MKNKKVTIMLLGLVLLVWAFAIFQIFSSVGTDSSHIEQKQAQLLVYNFEETSEDSFNLRLNYKDPFKVEAKRAKPVRKTVVPKKNKKIVTRTKVIENKKIDFSFIKYLGLIQNQKTNKIVALVSIKGSQRLVAEGDQVDGITFKKNLKDSILIEYNSQKVYIKR